MRLTPGLERGLVSKMPENATNPSLATSASEAEGRRRISGAPKGGAMRRPGGARGTKWSGHVPWGTAAKRRGGKTGRKSAPRVEARKAAEMAAFQSFVAGGGLEPPTSGL